MADAVAFSSVLAAAVGGALSLAAGLALAAPGIHVWIFLTSAGTFIIYNLDRLRDLEHDRTTSPIRTAFVSHHRQLLYGIVLVTAIGFAATLLAAPSPIIILCLTIGCVGLLHRRMKRYPTIKAFYVSASWVAAVVGLPWIASNSALGIWVAGVFFASLAANVIASNLRDDEVISVSGGHNTILWAARGFIVLALAIAIAAPDRLFALAWIPFCEGLALLFFRPTERYGHLVIDGALLAGALAASIHYL
jgi:4-hydroxybenzoate polyprenyltransferase